MLLVLEEALATAGVLLLATVTLNAGIKGRKDNPVDAVHRNPEA